MAKLFDGKQAEVRYAGIRSRENVEHVVVEAIAEGDSYRFWIDPNASLIRSVDLPVTLAQENQSTPQGWRVVALELRLPNASFAPPQTRASLNDMRFAELPTRPRYVSAMVPVAACATASHDRTLAGTLPSQRCHQSWVHHRTRRRNRVHLVCRRAFRWPWGGAAATLANTSVTSPCAAEFAFRDSRFGR